ncbi:MAG: NAD(P)-dependent alcohol dehydrogenase [Acidimicrobiales bacterium]
MRAAVCTTYGGPEVVDVVELATPEPADDELLVRVTSATVNRTSACIRAAKPPLVRLMYGLRKPRRPVLGTDFAGVIEHVGPEVRGLTVGDRVMGFDDNRMGAHGEYLTIPASAAIATIPDEVSDDDAAASVEGGHYALTNIEHAALDPGQRALVYGGGGAIGSTAIQLLVSRGVEVVAVAEDHQLDLMGRLGATRAIDYRAEDFTTIGQTFDLVFDAVGHTTFAACRPLLDETGQFMATELGPRLQNLRLSLTTRFGDGPRVHFPLPSDARRHVETVRDELTAQTLRPALDRTFDLDDIVDAHRYVDTATKTGNVILRVAPPVVG